MQASLQLDRSFKRSDASARAAAFWFIFGGLILVLSLVGSSIANLPPAIALLLLAAAIRRHQGTWLAPGAFFALVWCGYVWLGLLLAVEVTVLQAALWWIVASVATLYVGSLAGSSLSGKRGPRSSAGPSRWLGLEPFILLLSLVGFGAAMVLVLSAGRGLTALFSLQSLSQMASDLSVERYSSGYTEPLLDRIFTVAIYLAALLAGVLIATRPSRRAGLLVVLVILSAVSVVVVSTTRASLFWALILTTASYLATRVVSSAEPVKLFSWFRAFVLASGAIGVVTISVLAQMLRYQYTTWSQGLGVLGTLRVDFFGYLGVFSDWFQRGSWDQSGLGWGAYSFAGVVQLVGLRPRTPGLFGDIAYLGPERIPSNTFTIFRSLIQDFGLWGGLFVLLIVGFGAGMAFSGLKSRPAISIPVLSAFYATTLWSHTAPLLSYTTMLLAWILFSVYLFASRWRVHPNLIDRVTESDVIRQSMSRDGIDSEAS